MVKYKVLTDRFNTFFTNNKITVGLSAPTTGTHVAGDIVISSSANTNAFAWICTVSGTPGTWKVLKSGSDVTSITWGSVTGKPSTYTPTLGTTSTTAFRGDYGNVAYNHSQQTHAPSNAQKNSDITKAEIEARLTGNILTHTHSYAGSSSAGGAANSATKLSTARNLTIGNSKKSFNGTGDVSWTLAEIGAAAASHGNHVPTKETANNARFLRNDNTWQTITAANIGAAPETHHHNYLPAYGGDMTGPITAAYGSGSFISGNRGMTLICSNAPAGSFVSLFRSCSTNGYFQINSYKSELSIFYTAKSVVDAGTNGVSKKAVLLDESGNSTFPGNVNVSGSNQANGYNLFISTGAPTAKKTGDIWFDI